MLIKNWTLSYYQYKWYVPTIVGYHPLTIISQETLLAIYIYLPTCSTKNQPVVLIACFAVQHHLHGSPDGHVLSSFSDCSQEHCVTARCKRCRALQRWRLDGPLRHSEYPNNAWANSGRLMGDWFSWFMGDWQYRWWETMATMLIQIDSNWFIDLLFLVFWKGTPLSHVPWSLHVPGLLQTSGIIHQVSSRKPLYPFI